MGLIDLRDILPFPGGDNETDTIIQGVHLNRTALDHFNYTIYSNGTISNNSKCYLIFDNFRPFMFSNGSWVNGTNCDVPLFGVKTRGKCAIGFATVFAASIMFTLLNLRKHGQMFLREDKRFRIVGRRWQWYWMCFVAACGLISNVTGIDVDRDYLQGMAIILQSFFFVLMVPGTLAMVWEATRHWGSWEERQICDRDPFLLPQDDKRGKSEFYQPLVFYLFAWLTFFMTIPRSWTKIQKQHDQWQQDNVAEPAGTDLRFKVGGFLTAIAFFVICYNLSHNLHYYRPRSEGLWNRINTFCLYCPFKLFLVIIVLGVRVAYAIAQAFVWEISIFKYDVNPLYPYILGYGPPLLIIIIFNIYGYIDENEDKILMKQRRERGRAFDSELGIVKKPSWWSKSGGDRHLTDEQRLRALTTEVGGGQATTNRISANVEMSTIHTGHRRGPSGDVRDRSRSRPPNDPFRDESPTGAPPSYYDAQQDLEHSQTGQSGQRLVPQRTESDNASTMTGGTDATGLTGATLTGNVPPQRIRSMLDV